MKPVSPSARPVYVLQYWTTSPGEKRTCFLFLFGVPVIETKKRILALSMGKHELYMRRRRPDPVEILQMKAEAKHERKMKREER